MLSFLDLKRNWCRNAAKDLLETSFKSMGYFVLYYLDDIINLFLLYIKKKLDVCNQKNGETLE